MDRDNPAKPVPTASMPAFFIRSLRDTSTKSLLSHRCGWKSPLRIRVVAEPEKLHAGFIEEDPYRPHFHDVDFPRDGSTSFPRFRSRGITSRGRYKSLPIPRACTPYSGYLYASTPYTVYDISIPGRHTCKKSR